MNRTVGKEILTFGIELKMQPYHTKNDSFTDAPTIIYKCTGQFANKYLNRNDKI